MSKPFKFKQFTINQDRCAMKIGTDGVLLGAWASIANNPNSILDIGAGTGIISLMLAQRSKAENIEAIEIVANAYEQCVANFEASLWADRLFCYHAGLDELLIEIEEKYDLIVSNPPFYVETNSTRNSARDTARKNRSLPFEELVQSVSLLLSENGVFSTIIPFRQEADFLKLAKEFSLFPNRITRVKGNQSANTKRSLLELGFTQNTFEDNRTDH